MPRTALCLLLVAAGPGLAQAPKKANPQQVTAAERTLTTDHGCKLHRDDKAAGQPVDLVWFPPKTTNADLARMVVSVARLPGVKMIDLGETKVTDAGLKELARLPNLESVYLDKTAVTDAGLKELAGLQRLAWLDLADTKVTARGADTLAGMKSLQHLFLEGIKLGTPDVAKVATLTRLRSLGLGSGLPDDAMKEVGKLTDLETLRLDAAPGKGGFAELAKLTKLESLQIRGGLASIPADGWKVLAGLPELRTLDLSVFRQDDWSRYDAWFDQKREKPKAHALPPAAQGLGDLTQLKNLDLTGYPIGDDVLKPIGKLTGLEELCLTCTLVTLERGKELSELSKLRRLRVRNALVTNAGLRSLEPLKGLEVIWLYHNRITDDGVNRLQKALPRTTIWWKPTKGTADHRWRVPGGYGR
jgi:internalin A